MHTSKKFGLLIFVAISALSIRAFANPASQTAGLPFDNLPFVRAQVEENAEVATQERADAEAKRKLEQQEASEPPMVREAMDFFTANCAWFFSGGDRSSEPEVKSLRDAVVKKMGDLDHTLRQHAYRNTMSILDAVSVNIRNSIDFRSSSFQNIISLDAPHRIAALSQICRARAEGNREDFLRLIELNK